MASGNIVQNGLLPMPLYAETYKDISDGNVSGISLELFPHNQRAYNAACHLLRKEGKAAIIHPTGTGKSFIAFRLVFDNPKAAVLWLSPSEYIFRTQVENLKKSLLSGDSVKESPKEKMLAGDSAKENRRKGTELEKVKLLKQVMGNLEFMTYSKLMLCTDFNSEKKLDYIILDEFHRCGAAEWGKGVQRILLEYPEAKVLGLSATNVRYLDGQRDMAEELFEGCVASKMTLGEAVAAGLLPGPIYVVSMYSCQKELERLEKRIKNGRDPSLKRKNEELLEKLRRSLGKADGLERVFGKHMKNRHGKYIVFCSGKGHMEEMVSHVGEWFFLVDKKPHIYQVACDNPDARKQFEAFQKDGSSHLKLLFCIDMLNEGVHVEGVDGVILLRPTVSPTLYLQQIGRGLAAGRGKKKQPVVFDIVNNFESLSSIDSLQGEFAQGFAFLRRGEGGEEGVQSPFRIIDELLDCREIFAAICRNLSSAWDVYYQEAEAFYKREGHLEVKERYVTESGLNLGAWIQTQRRVRAGTVAGHSDGMQIKRLDAVGMRWKEKKAEQFEKGIAALGQFVAENGHGDAGIQYKTADGFLLGKWLCSMRSSYKKGSLEEGIVKKLEDAGMVWDVREYRWEAYYRAAAEYKDHFGNLEIPCNYMTKDGKKLGIWLNNQKSSYRRDSSKAPDAVTENGQGLTEGQVQKLKALGIFWDGKRQKQGQSSVAQEREAPWEYRCRLAKAYYKEHGSLDISQQYVTEEGIWLGKWISVQKMKQKKGSLESWKKDRLEEAGVCWESASELAFEKGCKALEEYFRERQGAGIPKGYVAPDGYRLGGWVYRQKKKKRDGKLTGEQEEKLTRLGVE